jgi:lipopolysaccharide transport system permease protein
MSISATDKTAVVMDYPTPPDIVERPATETEPAPSAHDNGPELVIRPRKGWIAVDWRELLSHRELLFFLIWRDVKVKYKQAILGMAWAVLVPICSMAIFVFIGKAAKFNDHIGSGIPYPLFVFAGLLPWFFFQTAISGGGMSLVSQQNLLSKIYLPRLFMPASTIGSSLIDMSISFTVLFVMMVLYRYPHPHPLYLLALPVLLIVSLTLALGIAFSLSAMTVNYRDLRFLIPFLSQILMWLSAAMYPAAIFGKYERILMFNPIFGLINGFRSSILGLPWHWDQLGVALVESVALFIFGLFYFRRAERRFADIA